MASLAMGVGVADSLTVAAVRKLRAHGVQSIDVGCMQVNLYQHPQAFTSLSQAFEPQANIAYAASFLRTLYDEGGSWKKAAAHYHSRTPGLASGYVSQVYDSWYTIIDKLRAARLQVPESSVAAMKELKNPSRPATRVASSASPHVIHVASVQNVHPATPKTSGHASQTPAPYERSRMNSISVAAADSPAKDSRLNTNIIVINSSNSTPAPAQMPEIKTADNSYQQTMPAAVVARADAPMTASPAVVTPIAIPASLAPTTATTNSITGNSTPANQTPAQAVAIQTANGTLQAPVQPVLHAAQALITTPVSGYATEVNALSELSPAAGRHVLAVPSDERSGPNFIIND